jgi:hypothetical protein
MDKHFSARKMVQNEQFPFQFGKWFEISNGKAFYSSENGLDQMVIFVMKMVRWIVDVP